MIIEEELRRAAHYLRTQHPRPVSNGKFIDELIWASQLEIMRLTRMVLDIAGSEPLRMEPRPVMRDEDGHELEWAPGDIVHEPRPQITNIGE